MSRERKQGQRAEARARLAAWDASRRAAASAAIAEHLSGVMGWRQARTVALFAPLPGEPDPGWPRTGEFEGGPAIAFPRLVAGPDGLPADVELRAAASPGELVATHAGRGWSLREPPADAPRIDPAAVEAVLVPGVAFDRAGRRLGRGGGFYDRLLARLPEKALRIGLFFSPQELAEICEESHDLRLDMIVTERESIFVRSRS